MTYSTTHQRSAEVQFGRYQKNILQELSMVKNLSCVNCAAWNVFPINSPTVNHTYRLRQTKFSWRSIPDSLVKNNSQFTNLPIQKFKIKVNICLIPMKIRLKWWSCMYGTQFIQFSPAQTGYSHLSNKRDVTLTDFEKFHPPQNKNQPYTFIDFLESKKQKKNIF